MATNALLVERLKLDPKKGFETQLKANGWRDLGCANGWPSFKAVVGDNVFKKLWSNGSGRHLMVCETTKEFYDYDSGD